MDGEYEFNSRVIVFSLIGIIFLTLIFFPYQILEKPVNTTAINLTLTDEDKIVIYSKLSPEERLKVTNYLKPQPTLTPIIQTVYVTPTIDGKTYFASEYQNGIRKINRPFTFMQEDVLGLKDIVVHANTYDYKIFNSYHWFNPADYKYYETYPLNPENKFIFIFYSIYMDDIQGDDTGFWITKEEQMNLQTPTNIYQPVAFSKQIRIKELEYSYNENDDSLATAYNSIRVYKPSIEYAKTAGETYENISILRGGISNKIDGYILFEIEQNTRDEDLTFAVNYHAFGDAQWKLK